MPLRSNLKYVIWIVAALVIAAMDLFVDTHPWNEENLEGITDFLSCGAFLLTIPVLLPNIFILHCLGVLFHTSFIECDTKFSERMQLSFIALGDIFVCFLYFLLISLIWRGWKSLLKK
jgi:hypothetical protein